MIKFLKYTAASFLGCLIALGIIFILMIGFFGAIASFGNRSVVIKNNSILEISLNYPVVERSSQNPLSGFDYLSMRPKQEYGLNDILKSIKDAKTDSKIAGIYLNLNSLSTGFAKTEEIRRALEDFKRSGKFIISYSDTYSQKAYYLASVADKIYMNPRGDLLFKGMSSQVMFFKNTLEKLDIDVEIIRHGKFKSAIEPFMLESMSPENKEQTATYIGAIWDCLLTDLSEARKKSKDELNAIANGLKVYSAQSALDNGLVDGLKYKDEILDELAGRTNVKVKNLNFVTLSKYGYRDQKKYGDYTDRIALIYADGDIVMGSGNNGEITSDGMSEAIREARNDSTIKAIVFRINSGGGSALASEIISREIELAAKVKPVVTSFGDVAASGGYYIATHSNVIVADPTTITGSIGVFGLFPNMKNFMNKKLGVTVDVVRTNQHADMPSALRPMTAEERDLFQLSVEETYDAFITHVSQGRNISKEQVDEIGQGRVWSAVDAKRLGLVDEFGGVDRAIEIAVDKAGLTNYDVVELPRQSNPLDALLSMLGEEISERSVRKELGENYKHYKYIRNVINASGIQARLPYEIELY